MKPGGTGEQIGLRIHESVRDSDVPAQRQSSMPVPARAKITTMSSSSAELSSAAVSSANETTVDPEEKDHSICPTAGEDIAATVT